MSRARVASRGTISRSNRVALAGWLAVVGALAWLAPWTARAQETPVAEPELGARAVVSTTPVIGAGVDRDRLPSDVQVLDRRSLAEERALGLHGALNARAAGISINDVQDNPLQPDVSFRGFTASPLLGTPQGLAVYQNGVRINEPFGDLLQWDLIPEFAVDQVQIIAGANPVFGLNSLGGSLALQMKDGYRFQGFQLSGSGGSFGRARGTAEYGAVLGDVAVYEGIDYFHETGFRDHSESHAQRLYADVRHAEQRYELGTSLTLASNRLRGNGPAPFDLLQRDRSAVFTWPDITDNDLLMLSAQSDVLLSSGLSLQTVAHVRHLSRGTFNGDEADFQPCPNGGPLCANDGTKPLQDEAGHSIPLSAGGDAVLHTTDTDSTSYGATVQVTLARRLLQHENQLAVGASADAAYTDFSQRAEIGALTANRGVEGSGFFLGGAANRTLLDAHNVYLGLYATDTLSLTEHLHLTLAARLNRAYVELEDMAGSDLDGTHGFTRLNPAAGLAYQLPASVTIYGGYSESNRAPSAAELACANPDAPCRVPNAFLSDPALAQVVNRALELGVRGHHQWKQQGHLRWSLAIFGSRNSNDIAFVAGTRIGTGFFRNAGHTQRAGLEANVEGRTGLLHFFAGYQLLRATFEDELTLPGANHPLARVATGGRRVIDVKPGDRLPGLPEHSLKLGFSIEPFDGFHVGPEARYSGPQYLRGDEANLLAPLHGYFVLGAHASYLVLHGLTLFVDAQNLLDTHYETFGILGHPSDVLPFATNPRFLGPAPPFGIWAGIELVL